MKKEHFEPNRQTNIQYLFNALVSKFAEGGAHHLTERGHMQDHVELGDEVEAKRLQCLCCLDHLLNVHRCVLIIGVGVEGAVPHPLERSEVRDEWGQLTRQNCLQAVQSSKDFLDFISL